MCGLRVGVVLLFFCLFVPFSSSRGLGLSQARGSSVLSASLTMMMMAVYDGSYCNSNKTVCLTLFVLGIAGESSCLTCVQT